MTGHKHTIKILGQDVVMVGGNPNPARIQPAIVFCTMNATPHTLGTSQISANGNREKTVKFCTTYMYGNIEMRIFKLYYIRKCRNGKMLYRKPTNTLAQKHRSFGLLNVLLFSYGIFVLFFAPTTWTSDFSDIAMPPEGISPLQIQYTWTWRQT